MISEGFQGVSVSIMDLRGTKMALQEFSDNYFRGFREVFQRVLGSSRGLQGVQLVYGKLKIFF